MRLSAPRLLFLVVASSSFLALACSMTPTVSPDDVQIEAQAHFNRAVALLDAGDIVGSWRAVQEMNGIVDAYLEPNPMAAHEGPRDPVAMGRPLGEWQEEWNHRYRLSAQIAWPAIRRAIEDETVDLSLLKGYASEFLDKSYMSRIGDEYERLEPVFRARRAQQYRYSCEDIGNNLCNVVRDAVASRMPQGTVTTSWTGNRDDYRGTIEVDIQVLTEVSYVKGNEQRGRVPESASVSFNITTARGGSSRWDGLHSFTISGDLPSRIAPHELPRVTQEQWETLRRDLESQLAAWPPAD